MGIRVVTASFLVFMILSFISNAQTMTKSNDESARKDSLFKVLNFDTTKVYEPICLYFKGKYFKGKPLLSLGQKKESLSDKFYYNLDPNGMYRDFAPEIWDYYSTFYFISQTQGSLNGMLHFSTDNSGRIFTIQINWLFDVYEMTETAQKEVLRTLSKIFPCLENQLDFQNNREITIDSKDYRQTFILNHPDEVESSFKNWRLSYVVTMK